MKDITEIRLSFEKWKKENEKKYLSFSPFDAYLAGYLLGTSDEYLKHVIKENKVENERKQD